MFYVPTSFKLVDGSVKWALVTVADADGALVREFAISPAAAAAVLSGRDKFPDGCTPDEWATGRSMMQTKITLPGQAHILKDGTLILNYGVRQEANKLRVNLLRVPSWEFYVQDNVLHLEATTAAGVDKKWL
jgi:hypothetical protein